LQIDGSGEPERCERTSRQTPDRFFVSHGPVEAVGPHDFSGGRYQNRRVRETIRIGKQRSYGSRRKPQGTR